MDIITQSTRQQFLRLTLSLLIVATSGFGIVSATSGAMFTDTTQTAMDISSGWVDIHTDDSELLALSNLKPGDTVFRPFNIANLGSLALSYALTVNSPTGQNVALFDALQVATWRINLAENCTAANFNTGTSIATSSLTNLAINNSNMPANTAETLCFVITLPNSASNSASGKNTRATLTVASQQV